MLYYEKQTSIPFDVIDTTGDGYVPAKTGIYSKGKNHGKHFGNTVFGYFRGKG